LGNCPPQPGSQWRANFYRLDYDAGPASHWAWDPRTGTSYHDFNHFGTIIFNA
jgi:hypothetical protein